MTGPREWRHAEDCYASQHFDSGIRRKCTCGLSLLRDALDQGHRVVVGPEGVEGRLVEMGAYERRATFDEQAYSVVPLPSPSKETRA